MMSIAVNEIGPSIWWARVAYPTKAGYEFEGDIFQGPNAKALAKSWRPQLSERAIEHEMRFIAPALKAGRQLSTKD